jgi:Flp pilus assembly protein TadG
MTRLLSLRGDQRGAAAIEMAIALPVLVTFIWGIFKLGVAFQANAGMQHALGEGARLATLCYNPDPDTGCETPTDAEITTRISQKMFGTGIGSFSTPTVTTPPSTDCENCRDLSVTYTMPMDFLFFEAPDLDLTRTKRVYLAG